jgi:hypothetical protein
MTVFWDVLLCSLMEVCQYFRAAYCLRHQGDKYAVVCVCLSVSVPVSVFVCLSLSLITLMMEAVRTSEMSVTFYQAI